MSCVVVTAALLGFVVLARLVHISAFTLLVSGGIGLVASGIIVVVALAGDLGASATAAIAVLVAELIFLLSTPGVERVVREWTDARRDIELREAAKRHRRSPEEERRYRLPD